MTKRILFPLALILLFVSACSLFDDSSAEVPATEAFVPESNTSLPAGEHHYTEFTIPDGVSVALAGDVNILVDGNIQIAGTLQGDCATVDIRAGGDLSLIGQINNSCSDATSGSEVRLVLDGLATIGPTESAMPAILSGGDITIADTEGENLDLDLIVSDAEEALAPAPGSSKQISPPRQGDSGVTISAPIQPGPGGSINIPFNMQGAAVTVANSLTAQDGAPGADLQDAPNCDGSGNQGKPGGSIRLATPNGMLVVNPGSTLTAGNGGKGGDCTTQGTGGDQTARAGDGGRGGSVLVGGRGLTMTGVNIVRGSGGPGGNATAEAGNAEEECGRGFNATATAGEGGDRGGVGYVIIEPANVTGPPSVSGGNGGRGGNAVATAGDGEECNTCPAGEGGKGGDATASGGQGGRGATRSLNWNITEGHKKGDGGNAIAKAGDGKNGATCCDPHELGGNGGAGGAATATAGQPGTQGKVDGIAGTSGNSPAGSGGDGEEGAPGLVCADPIVTWIDDLDDPLVCETLLPSDIDELLDFTDITSVEIELNDLGEYIFRTAFDQVTGDLEPAILNSNQDIFEISYNFYNPLLDPVTNNQWAPNTIAQQAFYVTFNRFTGEFDASMTVVEDGQWVLTEEIFPFSFEGNTFIVTLDKDQVQPDSTFAGISGVWAQGTNRWVCDEAGLEETGLPGIKLPGPVISRTVEIPSISPTPIPLTTTVNITDTGGTYRTNFEIIYDPRLHGPHVSMPDELPVIVVVTDTLVTFFGPQPFVNTSGTLNSDGKFDTRGTGVVAGFQNISVIFTGQFSTDNLTYTGVLTMGDGGGLPNNDPIAYSANGARPPPDEQAAEEAWVDDFAGVFNGAFEDQNTDTLFDRLNPAVLNLYGVSNCQDYLESIISNPIQIGINDVEYVGTWSWERDGQVIDIPDAYSVQVDFTVNGESSEVNMHLTRDENGDGEWFTDCGEPQ